MDLALTLVVVFTLVGLSHLINRRDIMLDQKIPWFLVMVFLNGLGTTIYFLFGPRRDSRSDPDHPDAILDERAKEIRIGNTSWNPIVGENHWGAGKQLNPKWDDTNVIEIPSEACSEEKTGDN